MALIQTIFEAFWSFGGIFFYCEFGERLGQLFVEVDDTIYQLDWYLYPEEIRRMLPTLIINVQEPMEIECFGSLSCCRDAFKQVSRSVFTPFILHDAEASI